MAGENATPMGDMQFIGGWGGSAVSSRKTI